jgi:hypothetical protein
MSVSSFRTRIPSRPGNGKYCYPLTLSDQFSQQESFDVFVRDFNFNRLHEALEMQPPANYYESSLRQCAVVPAPLYYPTHDLATTVETKGGAAFRTLKTEIYGGQAFAGQPIGFREICATCWVANFMDLELGYVDFNSQHIQFEQNRERPEDGTAARVGRSPMLV